MRFRHLSIPGQVGRSYLFSLDDGPEAVVVSKTLSHFPLTCPSGQGLNLNPLCGFLSSIGGMPTGDVNASENFLTVILKCLQCYPTPREARIPHRHRHGLG